MRNREQREKLMEKLADAFVKMELTAITATTNHCRDEILTLVSGEVKNIIDIYEKEHIVKELLKLYKENPQDLDILHMIAVDLLSENNFNEFHDKRTN